MSVASIILDQLGASRFALMTGAKNFVGAEFSLTMDLPARLTTGGANKARITLDASDTYTVETFKYRPRHLDLVAVSNRSDVHAEDLQGAFCDLTGLATRL